jgi:D-hydroxyproline dehydrogenase subunit gamma
LRFRRLESAQPEARVEFRFNGTTIVARPGETLAAALLAAGHVSFRRSVAGDAMHGPYCLMGTCFECLVEIAGTGRRQACMTTVAEGMEVSSA